MQCCHKEQLLTQASGNKITYCIYKYINYANCCGQYYFTLGAFLLVNTGAVVTDLEKRLGWKLTYPQCILLKK